MGRRSRGLFLFVAVAVVLLIFLIMTVMRPKPDTRGPVVVTPVPQQQTRVLVAKGTISEGAQLTIADMAWVNWPRENVPKTAITQAQRPNAPRDYAGYRARSSFSANEIIQESKLVPPDGGGWVASILPDGHRLVTFSVTALRAGGGFIQPKDKVDIVLSPRGSTAYETVAILLVDVPVFAINGYTDASALAASAPNRISIDPNSITVQVTIEQANLLLEVSRSYELVFNLRPLTETGGNAIPFEDTRTMPLTIQKFDRILRSR